ncbi:hypothetical protein AAHA92_21179 [Salvia divinorum]|uniref:Uncharacterized protein n=1 Tax=Salvia divinorum TaxID=28513 RepID=A0ABD1GKT9_SALDI
MVASHHFIRTYPVELKELIYEKIGQQRETVSRIQEQQSAAELQTISGRPPTGVASVEDGEEVEQCVVIPVSHRWSSVTAPFGVSVDLCGAHKASHSVPSCQNNGELPDTRFLGRRLQKKLASEGVGFTLDGANLLNNGLDVYLKNMISQCIDVGRSRVMKPVTIQRQSNGARTMQTSEHWSMQFEKVCNYALP